MWFGLFRKKRPFVRLDPVDHPVLGRLEPDPQFSGALAGSVTLNGTTIELQIEPGEHTLEATLALASDAVTHLADFDARCRALAAAEFLGSYNTDWRFGARDKPDGSTEAFEKPLLDEAGFAAALQPVALDVWGARSLGLSYGDGDMFWGHWVRVSSFDGLGFSDTHVRLEG